MWIFLSKAFLSIVDKDCETNELLVRARRAGDIESVFPGARVTMSSTTDYRYRARVSREELAAKLADEVRAIGYENFKSTVRSHDRHDAYMGTWQAMHSFQRREPAATRAKGAERAK